MCPVCPVCVPAPPGVFLPVRFRYSTAHTSPLVRGNSLSPLTHTHEVASRALRTRRDSGPAPPPNTFESNIALRAEVLKNVDEH